MKKHLIIILLIITILTTSCGSIEKHGSNETNIIEPLTEPESTAIESKTENEESTEATEETYHVITEVEMRERKANGTIQTLDDYLEFSIYHNDLQQGFFIKLINESEKYKTAFNELPIYEINLLKSKIASRTIHFDEKRSQYELTSSLNSNAFMYQLYLSDMIHKIFVIDDDHVCFVFKAYMNDNSNPIVYTYVVYQRFIGKDPTYPLGENWYCIGEEYFIRNMISFDYFNDLKPGDIIGEERLRELVMLRESGGPGYLSHWYNDARVKLLYDENDTTSKVGAIHKAAIMTRDGVVVLTTKIAVPVTTYEREILEIEYLPYGQKSEKYPIMSILADGFVPLLPE